jgi:hypothetical protein
MLQQDTQKSHRNILHEQHANSKRLLAISFWLLALFVIDKLNSRKE